MKSHPLSVRNSVSFIITVYNRSKFLSETIKSVLRQTDPDFTLIIWDDGSLDDSIQIAKFYAKQDLRIQVIEAAHEGASIALKDAISHTNSSYIGCIDSDDILAPNALAETRLILDQQPEVGMVYTNYRVIDVHGNCQGMGKRCQIPYSRTRLLTDFMTFHFRLIRRIAYDAAGGTNSNLLAAIDYDMCLRLSEVTQIYHHSNILYSYRTHPNSISTEKRQLQIDCAAQVVRQALKRRHLDSLFQLEIQAPSKFILKPFKNTSVIFRHLK